MIPLIIKVKPLPTYRLYVEMGSGSKLEVDFSSRIETIGFYPLKNLALTPRKSMISEEENVG